MVARFKADRDEEYAEFLDECKDLETEIAKETATNKLMYAELNKNDVALRKLQSWLKKIRKLDFDGATLATNALERLLACKSLLDVYTKRVGSLTTKTVNPQSS